MPTSPMLKRFAAGNVTGPSVQRRILDEGVRAKDWDSLSLLCATPMPLDPQVDAALRDVTNGKVRFAWLSRRGRSREEILALVEDDTRLGVAQAVARAEDLPLEVYGRLAQRHHSGIAAALASNSWLTDPDHRALRWDPIAVDVAVGWVPGAGRRSPSAITDDYRKLFGARSDVAAVAFQAADVSSGGGAALAVHVAQYVDDPALIPLMAARITQVVCKGPDQLNQWWWGEAVGKFSEVLSRSATPAAMAQRCCEQVRTWMAGARLGTHLRNQLSAALDAVERHQAANQVDVDDYPGVVADAASRRDAALIGALLSNPACPRDLVLTTLGTCGVYTLPLLAIFDMHHFTAEERTAVAADIMRTGHAVKPQLLGEGEVGETILAGAVALVRDDSKQMNRWFMGQIAECRAAFEQLPVGAVLAELDRHRPVLSRRVADWVEDVIGDDADLWAMFCAIAPDSALCFADLAETLAGLDANN